jgi:hypothetical protein
VPESPSELLDDLFDGKETARPLYDYVRAQIELLGEDVAIEPKRDYVAFTRGGRQLAVLRPATPSRLDLGLVLPDAAPTERFAAAGSFGSPGTTHRVSIVSEPDVDGELLFWLRAAYDAAAD